jgi:1-acyl-sn-glycerol-3-phosphate acyltransferase
MVPSLPAAVPRSGGALGRLVGRVALRVLGWRIDGALPNEPRLVVIAAPHRTNWDFVVGIAAKFALGLEVSWLGKHTLFRGPLGMLLRRWGGIPVDRRTSHHTVASVIERFNTSERLIVALAPEGTRKPGAVWKTGFWHIAHGAGVPILPIAFDWNDRVVHLLPSVATTDAEADIERFKATYARFRARNR